MQLKADACARFLGAPVLEIGDRADGGVGLPRELGQRPAPLLKGENLVLPSGHGSQVYAIR